jgi:hypothetical protein
MLLTDLIEKAKSDPSINVGGDGVVATNGSVGNAFKNTGSMSVGGNFNISSNVQNTNNQSRKDK